MWKFSEFSLAVGAVFALGLMLAAAPMPVMAENHEAAAAADAAQSEQAKIPLIPHRAVYELKLGDATSESGIVALRGRMVFEFTGAACEGYAVTFRFVTEISDTEGNQRVSDLRSSSYEDGAQQAFRFITQHFLDNKKIEEVKGAALRSDGRVEVTLDMPAEKTITAASMVMFPTEHLIETLERAHQGENFFGAEVYDGSDKGDQIYDTATVIGQKTGPEENDQELEALPADIAQQATWPITLSYFDTRKENGEMLPVYELSFLLYDNGISRRITMGYGDFSIVGTLKELELLDSPQCTKNK